MSLILQCKILEVTELVEAAKLHKLPKTFDYLWLPLIVWRYKFNASSVFLPIIDISSIRDNNDLLFWDILGMAKHA